MQNKGMLLDEVKQSLWKETSARLITESIARGLEGEGDWASAKELHPDYDITKSLKEIQEAASFYNFLRQRSQVKISDLASNYKFKKGSMSIGSRIHEVDSPTHPKAPSLVSEAEGGGSYRQRRLKPETSILGVQNRQVIQIEDAKRNAQTELDLMVHQDLNRKFAMVQTSSRRVPVQTTSRLKNSERTPSGQKIRVFRDPNAAFRDAEVLTQMDIDLETPGLKRGRPQAIETTKGGQFHDQAHEIPSPLKLEPTTPYRKGSEASGEFYAPMMMRTQSQPLTSSIQQFRRDFFGVQKSKAVQLNPVAETLLDVGGTPVHNEARKPSLDSAFQPKESRASPLLKISDRRKVESPYKTAEPQLIHESVSAPTSEHHSLERPQLALNDESPSKSQKVSVLKLISMFEKRVQPPKSSRRPSILAGNDSGRDFLISSLTARNPFNPVGDAGSRSILATRIQVKQRSLNPSPDTSAAPSARWKDHRPEMLKTSRVYSETKQTSQAGDTWSRSFINKALETEMKFAQTTGSLVQAVDGAYVFSNHTSVRASLNGVLNRNHNPIVRGRILRNLEKERQSYHKRSNG